jgi:hypothetical protein
MLTVLSALVSAVCVLASGRRLALAVTLTSLDPQILLGALRCDRPSDWTTLRDAIEHRHGAAWECDLLAALGARDQRSRVALVDEQLRELDWRAQRWARVPGVCARVATSAGFLFACVALMRGLTLPAGEAVAGLVPALNAFAAGIAGTSFCAAVHVHARRVLSRRMAATDRLVERLEALTAAR